MPDYINLDLRSEIPRGFGSTLYRLALAQKKVFPFTLRAALTQATSLDHLKPTSTRKDGL